MDTGEGRGRGGTRLIRREGRDKIEERREKRGKNRNREEGERRREKGE